MFDSHEEFMIADRKKKDKDVFGIRVSKLRARNGIIKCPYTITIIIPIECRSVEMCARQRYVLRIINGSELWKQTGSKERIAPKML